MKDINSIFKIFSNREDKISAIIEIVGKVFVGIFVLCVIFINTIERQSFFAFLTLFSFFMIFICFIALGLRSNKINR